jgi:DNA end-binding protein Ku
LATSEGGYYAVCVDIRRQNRMADTDGLEQRTKEELYELAKTRDIQGRSEMDKGELITALSAAETGNGEPGLERPTTTNRAVWKGAITFGLITVPIGLYTAIEDRDISFNLLTGENGARVRYQRVNAETGEEVEWDDIVKGYEYAKGSYVTFTNEELERIPADSVKAIDVVQFTQSEEIDPIYFERTYYVAPDETGVKAYRVLMEGLKKSGRVGLGKVTIREKERLCTLRPKDDVLVVETMNWPDEIRVPAFESLGKDVSVSPQEVEMATSLIEQLSGEFDPAKFHDSYRAKLEEAIAAKIEGEEITLTDDSEPDTTKVTDLLEALKASVEATREKRSA